MNPAPGSLEAIAAGCKCPENLDLFEIVYPVEAALVKADCPIHGEKKEVKEKRWNLEI